MVAQKYDNDYSACQQQCEVLDAWQRTTHPSYRPAIDPADKLGYRFLL